MSGLLLVPLDGSEIAAAALPIARLLGQRMGYRIALLTVTEPALTDASGGGAVAEYDRALGEARETLETAAAGLREAGLDVVTEVGVGPADEEIENVAVELGASIVVMATHGRSGLGRWLRGSVADKVIRRGTVPVLAVKPGDTPPKAGISRVVLPFDGSELSEAASEPAVALARAFDADLDIVEVVPWAGAARGEIGFLTAQLDREIEADALAEAEAFRQRLGYPRAHGVVLRGNASNELVNYALQFGVDLFVMTTHGRSGIVRFAIGSVADRIIGSGVAPVLLIRPQQSLAAEAVKRRRCFSCGRLAPAREVGATDRCLRCERHLHVCDNCVFFTGAVCLRDRPEVSETPRGLECPEFIFRETAARSPGAP